MSKKLNYLTILMILCQFSYQIEICTQDSDCENLYVCNEQICEHKKLFPMTLQEIFGSAVLGIIIGLANMGGLGGGPIIVPVLQILFNYPLKTSIYIGFVTILAGASGNYLKFAFLKNNINHGPLINYDLLLVNVPVLASGSIFGLVLNEIFPDLIICLLLVIVLVFSLQKTVKRLKSQLQKEKQPQNQILIEEDKVSQQTNEMTNLQVITKIDAYRSISTIQQEKQLPIQSLIIADEQKLFPLIKIIMSLSFLFISCFLLVVKGSDEYESIVGYEQCGVGYWLTSVLQIFITIVFEIILYLYLKKKNIQIQLVKLEIFVSDIYLTMNKIMNTGFWAGFFGGMCGIGGGTILTPIWLQMNYQPQVVTATSVAAVIFSSAANSFAVIYYGFIDTIEFLFFFGISIFCSFVIAQVLRQYIQKSGRESLLIYILIAKIGISLIILPYTTISQIIDSGQPVFQFKSFCN